MRILKNTAATTLYNNKNTPFAYTEQRWVGTHREKRYARTLLLLRSNEFKQLSQIRIAYLPILCTACCIYVSGPYRGPRKFVKNGRIAHGASSCVACMCVWGKKIRLCVTYSNRHRVDLCIIRVYNIIITTVLDVYCTNTIVIITSKAMYAD